MSRIQYRLGSPEPTLGLCQAADGSFHQNGFPEAPLPAWAESWEVDALIRRVWRVGILSDMASNSKTRKSLQGAYGGPVRGRILYLAPAGHAEAWLRRTGHGANQVRDICSDATPGCRAACLFTAGRGQMAAVERARLARTLALHAYPRRFLDQLWTEVLRAEASAYRAGADLLLRLNGTSDLDWTDFLRRLGCGRRAWGRSRIKPYDYTKAAHRPLLSPDWYPQTYSLAEGRWPEAERLLKQGHNVAAVFRDGLPATLNGWPVVCGDAHDIRLPRLDGRGVVVGLTAKGRAKRDRTGFVLDTVAGAAHQIS